MEELVQKAQDGDVLAFEHIYRLHVGRVYALCRRLATDPGLAEELTQDTFVRAWHRLDTFEPGTQLHSWLFKVALNVVLADRRTRGRRARWETAVDDPVRLESLSRRPEPRSGLDLEKAIARLPPGARQVFVLHDVEGFRHDEIATQLEITPGTSKAQLHRARKLLREALTR